jgi:Ca2+-binding RTX toxin-like protein
LFSATLADGVITAWGTAGPDRMVAAKSADRLVLSINNQSQSFRIAAVRRIIILGRGGNDRIEATMSPVSTVLKGGPGMDTLLGGSASDRLLGGLGDDRLSGGGNRDRLEGDLGADTLKGDEGNDNLLGGAGCDELYGSSGNDRLCGDDGCDYLAGGAGNDTLEAGEYDAYTLLEGRYGSGTDSGPETLLGGAGDDELNACNDWYGDWLDGGAGHDTAWYERPWGFGAFFSTGDRAFHTEYGSG